ncbi:MAG: hypothetical protein Q7R89_00845 [bacterium]|nr:hypothetical protein [bacterium]
MRKVNSKQHLVERKGIKFIVFVFSLFTIYYLLSTTAFAQSVDLLWQGDTYTPPFYQGKSLWSNQSRITFLAIPQGLGNPANLNYKWTKNGTVLGNINGVGKNTLSFTDSILSRPQTIEVDIISSNQGAVLASASVFVAPISPVLAIYENSPLYGFMFHKETSGIHELKEKEVTFTAFPLFFSVSNRGGGAVNYEWRTNIGEEAGTRNSVTYRAPDDAKGTSQVEVSASHKDKIVQSSSKSFLIKFGK